jgi:hypothetical protein
MNFFVYGENGQSRSQQFWQAGAAKNGPTPQHSLEPGKKLLLRQYQKVVASPVPNIKLSISIADPSKRF